MSLHLSVRHSCWLCAVFYKMEHSTQDDRFDFMPGRYSCQDSNGPNWAGSGLETHSPDSLSEILKGHDHLCIVMREITVQIVVWWLINWIVFLVFWFVHCFVLMEKSITSCSWLMAMTPLASTCLSCVPRLASCPRSPSCLTAASQRTLSMATTCEKSAWMRSSLPQRRPSFMTLSWPFLRYDK